MTKRAALLVLVALSACATPPRLDPDLRWNFHHGPGHPTLVYGIPESDALTVLVLECRPGARDVHVTDVNADAADEPIRLGSRPHHVTLAPETARPVECGGYKTTARLPLAHPLLQRFRASGRLELGRADGGAHAIPTDRTERAAIAGFFADCAS
jgi:hypothetical protein